MLRSRFRSALVIGSLCALGACANPGKPGNGPTSDPTAADGNDDPYESVNRQIWAFDITLDKYFLRPIAKGYRDVTPQFARTAVTNVLNNMKSPVILANDLLQGNADRFGDTLARMSLNTVLGLGGLIDVGAKQNIPFHDSDFGQTLGSWGVASGPYLVLPILGPSDPRDGIGYGIDSVIDPFSIEMKAHNIDVANYVRFGVGTVNERSLNVDSLDEIQRSSLDFYAAVRSLYQQQRATAVSVATNDGNAPTPAIPGDVEPTGPTPSKPPAPSGPTPSAPPAPAAGTGKAQQ